MGGEVLKKLFVIICMIGICLAQRVYGDEDMQLNAKSAVLIDAENGRILYGKNEREKLPMASTTKIMTCIIAIENGKMDEVVEVSDYAASMPDVQLNINKGEKYYLKDLLYSLMLESHNDTAVAIAEHIGGSVEGFAGMMNEKAYSIGAFDTHFVTPNGLDSDEHYSTAYDMALIASYALENDIFMEVINTPSHTFSDIDGKRSFTVNNKDAFLGMMDGAVGVKTGFTGNAGYCFVGAVYKDDKKFVSAVLASGWPPHKTYKWQDTIKLMNYGNDNYEHRKIFDGSEYYREIQVDDGIDDNVGVYSYGYEDILVSDKDIIEVKEVLNEKISAPVNKNQVVGKLVIKINSEKYREYCIKSCEYIRRKTYVWELKRIYSCFLLDFFHN